MNEYESLLSAIFYLLSSNLLRNQQTAVKSDMVVGQAIIMATVGMAKLTSDQPRMPDTILCGGLLDPNLTKQLPSVVIPHQKRTRSI